MTEFQGYKSPLNFSRKIAFSRFHSSILLSLLLLLHQVSKSIFCMNFTTSKEFWKRLSHHIHTQKIFDLQFIVSQFWTFSKFFFVSFCLDSSNLVYFRLFLSKSVHFCVILSSLVEFVSSCPNLFYVFLFSFVDDKGLIGMFPKAKATTAGIIPPRQLKNWSLQRLLSLCNN